MTTSDFPRLAMVSDVVPVRNNAGSLLLYRLLGGWPADRLTVIRGNSHSHVPGLEMPGVRYEELKYTYPRIAHTRLNFHLNFLMRYIIAAYVPEIRKRVERFGADAVLSVAHGHLWLAATVVGKQLGLPVHLICHDDWAEMNSVFRSVAHTTEAAARRPYRAATTRLCISPAMAEDYSRRFGAPCRLLYPTRGDDSPQAKVRLRPPTGAGPVVAYAGAINYIGYAEMVRRMADAAASLGGRVDLYGMTPEIAAARLGTHPALNPLGFFPPVELAERIGSSADVLYCPASFRPEDARAMRNLFPSKLADYTAIGLPIIVAGPTDSSAVRWARDYPGAAVAATDPSVESLMQAIQTATAPGRRETLAEVAVEVGKACFALESGRAVLYSALGMTAAVSGSPSQKGRQWG